MKVEAGCIDVPLEKSNSEGEEREELGAEMVSRLCDSLFWIQPFTDVTCWVPSPQPRPSTPQGQEPWFIDL